MRTRLWLTAALAVTLPAVLTGCGSDEPGPGPGSAAQSGWERLPDLPLSKRLGPVTAWTGTEVIAFGGDPGRPCPPNADCAPTSPMARDGAALDPESGTWRRLSSAPVGIPPYSPSALAGEHLFVIVEGRLLDYDMRQDQWSTLPRVLSAGHDLVADGDRLVLSSGSDENGVHPDLVYEVDERRWSRLPGDPIGPAFDRDLIPAPHGLVLTAKKLDANPGAGDEPSLVLAAILDRDSQRWRRLPDGDLLGSGRAALIHDRLIMPSLDSSNGGGDGLGDYGRVIPYGGRLDLKTGIWSRLPNTPEYLTGGWPVDAAGDRLIAAEGWLYDDAGETWTEVPRPRGGSQHPGPAVWAGDRLIVVGGSNDALTPEDAYDSVVWSWSPAGGPFQ